eukprot:TRINITY_DN5185_c0_g1_i1.p1 TRINITY_DN5185_c0_g1~~TRINITY_DN5185_c0_g1_i1.p1  ORF type:complete len:257 (+),score=36.08 TRINITY_DN5185_c0_g1_i1:143-913(+)
MYKMIFTIEKCFVRETSYTNLKSNVLYNELSENRTQRKFSRLMRIIQKIQAVGKEKSEDDYGLITFDEFMQALEYDSELLEKFLPFSLPLRKILGNIAFEQELRIKSDQSGFENFREKIHNTMRKFPTPVTKEVKQIRSRIERSTKLPGLITFEGPKEELKIKDSHGKTKDGGKEKIKKSERNANVNDNGMDNKDTNEDIGHGQNNEPVYSDLHRANLKKMKDKVKEARVDEVKNTFIKIDLNNLGQLMKWLPHDQ